MGQRSETHEDVRLLAGRARVLIETLFNALADHKPASNEWQAVVGLSLIRSSFEIGRAIAKLLEAEPEDFAAAAYALIRPQIEHYVRGAYFGHIASAAEVDAFLCSGSIPQRPRGGKSTGMRDITLREWHAIVHDDAGFPAGSLLAAYLDNTLSGTNGLLHGDRRMVKAYGGGEPVIAFSLPASFQVQLIEAALETVDNASIYYLRIALVPTPVAQPIYDAAHERRMAYHDERVRMLTV